MTPRLGHLSCPGRKHVRLERTGQFGVPILSACRWPANDLDGSPRFSQERGCSPPSVDWVADRDRAWALLRKEVPFLVRSRPPNRRPC